MKYKYKTIVAVAVLFSSIMLIACETNSLQPQETTNITLLSSTVVNLNFTQDYIANKNTITYDTIYALADNVSSSHEYILNVYDCTDFSSKLVDRLKVAGIKAECTAGYYNQDVPHTWVTAWVGEKEIHIEATGGYIIDDEDYKQNYEVRWEDFCW
jgi:transglutaminase-like putative cysteine protease